MKIIDNPDLVDWWKGNILEQSGILSINFELNFYSLFMRRKKKQTDIWGDLVYVF